MYAATLYKKVIILHISIRAWINNDQYICQFILLMFVVKLFVHALMFTNPTFDFKIVLVNVNTVEILFMVNGN